MHWNEFANFFQLQKRVKNKKIWKFFWIIIFILVLKYEILNKIFFQNLTLRTSKKRRQKWPADWSLGITAAFDNA